MRTVVCQLAFLTIALSIARGTAADRAGSASEPAVQWHFAGFDRIAQGTNAATLQAISKFPTTLALRDQTFAKLSRTLGNSFTRLANNSGSEASELIHALLNDLWNSESYFELKKGEKQPTEWLLAVRLSDERLRLWQTNCSQLSAGWELKSGAGSGRISFAASKSWFVVGSTTARDGTDAVTKSKLFQKIQQQGRPVQESEEYWMKGKISGLADYVPELKTGDLAAAEFQVNPRNDGLRSEVHLHYSKQQSWPLEKWSIPTNTIRDPLISFTAMRGFGPRLKNRHLIQELDLRSPPNQLFMWSQSSEIPLQIHAAVRMPRAKEVLARLETKTVPRWNNYLQEHGVGVIRPITNESRLTWQGMPLLIPSLRAVSEPGGEFLVGEIFPFEPNPFKDPPPAGLLKQITGRANLMYYDWEITEARLLQVRPLLNLLSLVINRRAENTNSVTSKWLDSVQPKLGETITEGLVTSPREITVVRRSHIGLSSLELLALVDWLESPTFPAPNFQWAFREPVRPKKEPRRAP